LFTLSGLFVFYGSMEVLVEKEEMKEQRETNGKFEARGSSIDGILFRANVVNNGRYRYVIPSFQG